MNAYRPLPTNAYAISKMWQPTGDAGGWRLLFPRAKRRPSFRIIEMPAFLVLTQYERGSRSDFVIPDAHVHRRLSRTYV